MGPSGPRRELKTGYRASPRSLRPLYTGGPVLLSRDGQHLITTMGEEVLVTEVASGQSLGRIRGDGSEITALALSYHTAQPTIITAHASFAVRYYPSPPSSSSREGSSAALDPPLLAFSRQTVKAHSAPILVSAVSPDSTLLATGSSDGIVKVWDLSGGFVTHLYRGHGGPVSALRFSFPTRQADEAQRMELWTGSTDGRVRVFDLRDASSRVVGGGGSGAGAGKPKHVLEGHVSVVRGVDVSTDGHWAVTGGRDKVVLVWDLRGSIASSSNGSGSAGKVKGKGKPAEEGPRVVQTIVAEEQVEALGLLDADQQGATTAEGRRRLRCYTGGDKGVVRVWDMRTGEAVMNMAGLAGVDEAEVDEDEQRGITTVLHDASSSSLISIHADQNIIYHSLSSGRPIRQIIGFNDDIIDAAFLSCPASSTATSSAAGSVPTPHTHLALATNSSMPRIYSTFSLDARLLPGHRDTVLCLDTSPDHGWLATGSKDHTARIWAPASDGEWRCVAICEGHAEAIGAVAFSRQADTHGGRPAKFLVTASQDRTIKLWDLSVVPANPIGEGADEEPLKPRSLATIKAHEKDINSLDLAPNDRFLASGSQDKLVKVYEVEFSPPPKSGSATGANGSIHLLGTCKGHRRGVWSVRFSRTDRVLASAAADKTIKLWSLDDFTCLKTFEGHTNSVLRVTFVSSGQQLLSTSSDGLMKLWNVRDNTCVCTMDNHEDKVWALAVSADEKTVVSAGADSVATFWEDATLLEQEEKNEEVVRAVQEEQDFTNYLAVKDYKRAISLALAMSQPGRLLNLFNTVCAPSPAVDSAGEEKSSYTGSREIDAVIRSLSDIDLVRLLKHVRDWNANSRSASTAQAVLYAILKLKTPEELLKAFETRLPSLDAPVEDAGDEEDVTMAESRPQAKKPEILGFKELMDGLIPYSERHFARLDRLVKDSYAIDYLMAEMDGGLFDDGMEVDGGKVYTNGH